MKRALAVSLFVVLLVTACRPNAAPAQVEAAEPAPATLAAEAALQDVLDEQVEQQGILGMAMAVRLGDGSIVFKESGTLDREGDNTWSMTTQTALGSITKTFTAVVLMQLIEEGKLSLDDTIEVWFPKQPNAELITVRMLLSHTSGLANYILPENSRDPKWAREWTRQALVDEANRNGPVGEPGSSVAHYSNTGYFLLGMIIEVITGNSWEQEIRSRIIEPLRLQNTTFIDSEGVWNGTMVQGYARVEGSYISTSEIPDYPHASTAWAAGAVVSTPVDLMTFASALFDGGLVSPESLAEMVKPLAVETERGIHWGLGGGTVDGLPAGSFGMGGDVPGYHAFFVGNPVTKQVVVAFVNTEEGDVVSPGLMVFGYLVSMETGGS